MGTDITFSVLLKKRDLFVAVRPPVRMHKDAAEDRSCRSDTHQTPLPAAGHTLGEGRCVHCRSQALKEGALGKLELLDACPCRTVCEGHSPGCAQQSAGEEAM